MSKSEGLIQMMAEDKTELIDVFYHITEEGIIIDKQ